eukprot:TRINITY_DN32638_c0_g1_i1.p1 TRINITY_DN32638_c0_g1~~TRINITY_DN32638_c0_g1_i1.p1  ORF type:complete len:570 (+),score=147.05 TRINITY_DN32638_c0_g1_i1:157-1866(+)
MRIVVSSAAEVWRSAGLLLAEQMRSPDVTDRSELKRAFMELAESAIRRVPADTFAPVDVARTLRHFAVARVRHQPLLTVLCRRAAATAAMWRPGEIADILPAMGFLQWRDEPVLNALSARLQSQPFRNTISLRQAGLILRAYADLTEVDRALFESLAAHILSLDPIVGAQLESRDIGDILWAFAAARNRHSDIFQTMGRRGRRRDVAASFNMKHATRTLWAYATSRLDSAGLVPALEQVLLGLMTKEAAAAAVARRGARPAEWSTPGDAEDLPPWRRKDGPLLRRRSGGPPPPRPVPPRQISAAMWSAAILRLNCAALLPQCAGALRPESEAGIDAWQAGVMMWAFAAVRMRRGGDEDAALSTVFAAASRRLQSAEVAGRLTPSAATSVVWACTKAEWRDQALFASLHEQLTKDGAAALRGASGWEMTQIACAYAQLQEPCGALLRLAAETLRRTPGPPDTFVALAWAVAVYGRGNPETDRAFKVITDWAREMLRTGGLRPKMLSLQSQATLLWAVTVFGGTGGELHTKLTALLEQATDAEDKQQGDQGNLLNPGSGAPDEDDFAAMLQ